jgi:flagellar basal-body rod modification protein FlgD
MSTVGATSSTTNAATALQSASGADATSDTKKAKDAQDRFLTLLVTQMKNQDPLNPLDNAQVTSQLAQLSTVEGIDKLNTTVGGLQASYQTSQALQSANLIGRGVLAPGNGVDLTGSKAVLGVELTSPADEVKLVIRDGSKRAVHTVNLGPKEIGVTPLAWDGMDDSGKQVADGHFTAEVVATRGGKPIEGASTLSFGQVGSVSSSNNGVKLNVPGQGAIDLSAVRQIL